MNKRLASIYNLMLFWNFASLLFILIVMFNASYRICDSGKARAFLNSVTVVPPPLWSTACLSIAGYILLAALLQGKRLYPLRRANMKLLVGILEVLLAFFILMKLNVAYTGILLLVIIDLVTEIQAREKRLILLAISLALYVLADYNLFSMLISMVSFQQYLVCYSAAQQNLLLGIRSVLSSVNLILFVVYILILLHSQRKEALRIQMLNQEINKANNELKLMNAQLVDYAKKAEKLTEIRERNRVAREIHDTIGHALTGISAGVDACITMIDTSPELTKKQLKVIADVARQGIKDVRRSVNKLRPDALENQPLEKALRDMLNDISTAAQINISFDNKAGQLNFRKDEEDVIYRVIQESITNAIRHGKAMQIYVTITRREKWITLTVHDTGIGCKNIKTGFGLRHMQERVAQLGGTVVCDGSDGFTVTAEIPIRWGEES